MPHPDAEHGLQIQLATALRERDEAKASRDEWRSGYITAAVTGRFPLSSHDNDPEIRSLREVAENVFHGQAYAEMAKRARVAEEALAAARLAYQPICERVCGDDGEHVTACIRVRAALAAPGDGEEGKR